MWDLSAILSGPTKHKRIEGGERGVHLLIPVSELVLSTKNDPQSLIKFEFKSFPWA